MISDKAIIHPLVEIGEGAIVEDFCEIGVCPQGKEARPTRIGSGAVIRSGTVIYHGNKIGDNFQTGHKANIREDNIIGHNVSIGTSSVVEHHVTIEDNVRLHTQVFVPEYCVLKESCWLGPNVVLTNAKYPKSIGVKESLEGCLVGEAAIVGANATVLPGVKLGKNSIIGAGSLVSKDIPELQVWAGNPARFIKNKEELPYK